MSFYSRILEESPEVRATRTIARKIALGGGAISRYQFLNPRKPYCDAPVQINRAARASMLMNRPTEVTFFVPCRKCPKCLQFRQMRWRERALAETRLAKRTWFVTLTFDPHHLAGILVESRHIKHWSHAARVERAAYAHVQKYFKRLRKQRGLKFRYLAVYERGEESGRSHYHLLIHEVGERPVTKRNLENKWRSYVHARLVAKEADGAASYITKYATKSLDVQPRASLGYGNANKSVLPDFGLMKRPPFMDPPTPKPPHTSFGTLLKKWNL